MGSFHAELSVVHSTRAAGGIFLVGSVLLYSRSINGRAGAFRSDDRMTWKEKPRDFSLGCCCLL